MEDLLLNASGFRTTRVEIDTWAAVAFAVGAFLVANVDAGAAPVAEPAAVQNNINARMPAPPPAAVVHDLSAADYDPPEAPDWCRETVPEAIRPCLGKNGLGSPWGDKPGPLAKGVQGIDRYQANHFVVYRGESAAFIYDDYTPLEVRYRPGTLPAYEAAVARYTAGCRTATEKAVALLTVAVPALTKHPTMPPCGARVPPGRGLQDGPLLESGLAWCNEQARIFARLCTVAGIPARIVHLFFSNKKSGHTIAEFYADGRWCMADASWFTVFPGPDGRLLSAAECHDRGVGQEHAGLAYRKRMEELVKLSDDRLFCESPDKAAGFRAEMLAKTARQWSDELDLFAVMNIGTPE
ncbi:MAG: hypothetical protein EBZ59_01865 [Planctomycetia bacterium]|nr:hypothetical protein [Planctomycetia bacterium]